MTEVSHRACRTYQTTLLCCNATHIRVATLVNWRAAGPAASCRRLSCSCMAEQGMAELPYKLVLRNTHFPSHHWFGFSRAAFRVLTRRAVGAAGCRRPPGGSSGNPGPAKPLGYADPVGFRWRPGWATDGHVHGYRL